MRVEVAGVGKYPHGGGAYRLGLLAHRSASARESCAVGPYAEHCYSSGPVKINFSLQLPSARNQLGGRQFSRRRRYTFHQIRNAVTVVEEPLFLVGVQAPVRKTGGVERRPEAVAGTREMVASDRCVEAGVDAAEEHAQARPDKVGSVGFRSVDWRARATPPPPSSMTPTRSARALSSRPDLIGNGLYVGHSDGRFVAVKDQTGRAFFHFRTDTKNFGPTHVVGYILIVQTGDELLGFNLPKAAKRWLE